MIAHIRGSGESYHSLFQGLLEAMVLAESEKYKLEETYLDKNGADLANLQATSEREGKSGGTCKMPQTEGGDFTAGLLSALGWKRSSLYLAHPIYLAYSGRTTHQGTRLGSILG